MATYAHRVYVSSGPGWGSPEEEGAAEFDGTAQEYADAVLAARLDSARAAGGATARANVYVEVRAGSSAGEGGRRAATASRVTTPTLTGHVTVHRDRSRPGTSRVWDGQGRQHSGTLQVEDIQDVTVHPQDYGPYTSLSISRGAWLEEVTLMLTRKDPAARSLRVSVEADEATGEYLLDLSAYGTNEAGTPAPVLVPEEGHGGRQRWRVTWPDRPTLADRLREEEEAGP